MKKNTIIIGLALTTIFFSGCFTPPSTVSGTKNTNSTPSTEQKSYANGEFSLTFPANWEIIQPKDFTSDIPFETQVVIRNNVKNEIFTATAAVSKSGVESGTSTLDFATAALNKQKVGLIDYKETARETIQMNIGGQSVDSYQVKFEAREKPNDTAIRFVQRFAVKGNQGYIILGGTSLQETNSVVNSVASVVESFKVN